jgi:hypothetical protein
LPYPAFRRVSAEPGGGKPSPSTLRNAISQHVTVTDFVTVGFSFDEYQRSIPNTK